MTLLALCGSIRDQSSNASLLKAIRSFFPQNVQWNHFEIKTLPYFDPQLQFSPELPAVVREFRQLAALSDFILISTPEYAHGIPGILKNSLEWLLCEETMKKKVLIFVGTSSGGEFVQEQLVETLRTMDFVASKEMTMVVRGGRTQLSSAGQILDPRLEDELRSFLSLMLKKYGPEKVHK